MLALRRSSRQNVVANKQLDGTDTGVPYRMLWSMSAPADPPVHRRVQSAGHNGDTKNCKIIYSIFSIPSPITKKLLGGLSSVNDG